MPAVPIHSPCQRGRNIGGCRRTGQETGGDLLDGGEADTPAFEERVDLGAIQF
jgi:hypothetical protein